MPHTEIGNGYMYVYVQNHTYIAYGLSVIEDSPCAIFNFRALPIFASATSESCLGSVAATPEGAAGKTGA